MYGQQILASAMEAEARREKLIAIRKRLDMNYTLDENKMLHLNRISPRRLKNCDSMVHSLRKQRNGFVDKTIECPYRIPMKLRSQLEAKFSLKPNDL